MRYPAIAFLGSAATRRYPQLTTMVIVYIRFKNGTSVQILETVFLKFGINCLELLYSSLLLEVLYYLCSLVCVLDRMMHIFSVVSPRCVVCKFMQYKSWKHLLSQS